MRVDKFLKLSRVIKRRTVAHQAATSSLIKVNGKTAKPSKQIKIGDEITVRYSHRIITIRVLNLLTKVRKEDADSMYEIIDIKEQ